MVRPADLVSHYRFSNILDFDALTHCLYLVISLPLRSGSQGTKVLSILCKEDRSSVVQIPSWMPAIKATPNALISDETLLSIVRLVKSAMR